MKLKSIQSIPGWINYLLILLKKLGIESKTISFFPFLYMCCVCPGGSGSKSSVWISKGRGGGGGGGRRCCLFSICLFSSCFFFFFYSFWLLFLFLIHLFFARVEVDPSCFSFSFYLPLFLQECYDDTMVIIFCFLGTKDTKIK